MKNKQDITVNKMSSRRDLLREDDCLCRRLRYAPARQRLCLCRAKSMSPDMLQSKALLMEKQFSVLCCKPGGLLLARRRQSLRRAGVGKRISAKISALVAKKI
jgi:hypothetical protein